MYGNVWKACSSSWERLCILTPKLNTRLLHSKSLWTFSFKNIVHLIVIFHHIYQANQNDVWLNQPAPLFLFHCTKDVELYREIEKCENKMYETKEKLFPFVEFPFIRPVCSHFGFSFIIFRLWFSGVEKKTNIGIYSGFMSGFSIFLKKRNHFIVRCIYSN